MSLRWHPRCVVRVREAALAAVLPPSPRRAGGGAVPALQEPSPPRLRLCLGRSGPVAARQRAGRARGSAGVLRHSLPRGDAMSAYRPSASKRRTGRTLQFSTTSLLLTRGFCSRDHFLSGDVCVCDQNISLARKFIFLKCM